MTLHIPEKIKRNKDWSDWIAQLPDLVDQCLKKWDLELDEPMSDDLVDMSYCLITPALRADGAKVILKVASPVQQSENELNERSALRLCNGETTIHLIDYDEATSTLLLERAYPGYPLAVGPDDDANTRIAARLMNVFSRPVPPDNTFRPTQYQIDGFERHRSANNGSCAPLPDSLVEKTESMYAEMMASSTQPTLLHADLHHYNILSAEREPWLIIDPKGYVGDPGYEVGAYLANYPEESCNEKDYDAIDRRRVAIMAEETGWPLDYVVRWGFILAMIWARWSINDPDECWRVDVRRAEVLEQML